jgi:signal transduction histidine kinase
MEMSLRLRLVILALLITALAATIVGAAVVTWRQVRRLRWHLSAVQIESFRVADHLQATVLDLDATLLRFALGRNPRDWQTFAGDADQLQAWLAQQHPGTARERRELRQVRAELGAYRAQASAIASIENPGSSDGLQVLSRIDNASKSLLNVGYGLASAHRAAATRLVDGAQRTLTVLQAVIFSALLLLMLLATWGLSTVYRELIAPLQGKLVESRASLERQEKLASLGVLAAGVAHEIRNPLTAIRARLFTLKKALGSERATVAADAELIERELGRLERLVRDVLLFARPAEPRKEAVSALGLLSEVRDLMRGQLEPSGIELVAQPVRDVTVQGDPHQLKQVLLNLVRNAAESIGEHGKITLSVDTKPAAFGRHSAALIEVRDTGKGIPAEVQKRLFDPFYTTKPAGTGLGLSIAVRIVEQHGGTLRYQTEVGRGTTFGVLLPLIPSSDTDCESKGSPSHRV